MQDDSDRDAVVVGQVAHEVEEFDLVAQVEVGGGFVEEEDAGLLGEAAGEPDALELSAGEVLGSAVGEFGDAGQGERPVDGLASAGVRAAPAAAVRVASELDDVPHAQPAGRGAPLEQQGDAAGELPGAERQCVGAGVEGERRVPRPLQPGDGAQQGGLAAAVRADQGGHFAGPQGQRGVVHDVGAVVRDGHIGGRQFVTASARGSLFTRNHEARLAYP